MKLLVYSDLHLDPGLSALTPQLDPDFLKTLDVGVPAGGTTGGTGVLPRGWL